MRIPFAAKSAAARFSSSGSTAEIRRPSNSWPPWQMRTSPPSASRSAVGHATIGGSASVAGSPSRITPVGASRRASTTAFVKCVVPIITACTRDTATPEDSTSARIADDDARRHVRRRRRLRLGEHVAAVDEDGVRVRAADVDADPHA